MKVVKCSKCVGNNLKWIKRIQFSLIICLCFGILVYLIIKNIGKFLEFNVGTADKYVLTTEAAFPELTICPSYPYKLDVLQRNGINSRHDIQFHFDWISKDSKITPQQLYSEVVIGKLFRCCESRFWLKIFLREINFSKPRS